MNSLVSDAKRLRVSLAQWKKLDILHGFSTRRVKIRPKYFYETEDFSIAKEFCESLKISLDRLVFPRQIHASHIAYLPGKIRGQLRIIPDCDGLISRSKELALAVLSADCLPLLFFDEVSGSIGIAHAGWRGLEKQLPRKMAENMIRFCQVKAENLRIAIGPAIRACCYEVRQDVAQFFPKSCHSRNGKLYLDLVAEARRQLEAMGVPSNQITDTTLCTHCRNDEFFSYRKEGETAGRILSLVMLRQS